MLRNLLICGLIAGACGGLVASGFARIVGEPAVDQSIAYEEAHAGPAHVDAPGSAAHTHAADDASPVVSRTMQKSLGLLTASVVYGLALGGLFALAFAAAYARIGRASPQRTAVWLALGAFTVFFLVPFVKYPASPPAVGDPDTIGTRTGAYFTMILISVLAAVAAVRLRGILAERNSGTTSTLIAGAGYLLVVVVAGLLLPSVHEVPSTFPPETLFRFRESTLGMHLVLWTTLGLVFAGTAQRVMTGQTIIPRRRPDGVAATAAD
jgi:predicted cobalt transporter CbtA